MLRDASPCARLDLNGTGQAGMMPGMENEPVEVGSERRRSARVRARKQVVLRWSQSGNTHREESPTISLSLYGCAVHSLNGLPPGTPVTVDYMGKSREGKVLYTLVNHTAGMVEMAIGFSEDAEALWDDVEF